MATCDIINQPQQQYLQFLDKRLWFAFLMAEFAVQHVFTKMHNCLLGVKVTYLLPVSHPGLYDIPLLDH